VTLSYPPPRASLPPARSAGVSLEVARARRVLVAFGALAALLVAVVVDGNARRGARGKELGAVRAVAPLLPSNDLALAGGARWVRVPSMEEPGAAFSDGPALPDPDPAGGVMAPPRRVWAEAP
jgi:hypothetical protein